MIQNVTKLTRTTMPQRQLKFTYMRFFWRWFRDGGRFNSAKHRQRCRLLQRCTVSGWTLHVCATDM